MTGPMYDNERMQELAEDNTYIKGRLREAEIANAEYAAKMRWTPAEWDAKLTQALEARAVEYHERIKLERELINTKKALADALHDAKRWRAIAEDGNQ